MSTPTKRDIDFYRKFFEPGGEFFAGSETEFQKTYDAIQKWIADEIRPNKIKNAEEDAAAFQRRIEKYTSGSVEAVEEIGILNDTVDELRAEEIIWKDVSQYMWEMLDEFVFSYENTYGVAPSFEENGPVDYATYHIVHNFLGAQKGVVVNPEFLGFHDNSTEIGQQWNRVWSVLDPIYERSTRGIANQPFHFSEWSKKEAVKDAMVDYGVIEDSDRRNTVFQDTFDAMWDTIQIDLQSQSTSLSSSVRAMANSFIRGATGNKTGKHRADFGYITTLHTNAPRTKEEFRNVLEAGQSIEQAHESDLTAIGAGNSLAWTKAWYGNPIKKYALGDNFRGSGGSTERQTAYDEWINHAAALIHQEYEKVTTELNPDGTLKYTPEEAVGLIEQFADKYYDNPFSVSEQGLAKPDLDAIDAKVARDKAVGLYDSKAKALDYINNVFLPHIKFDADIPDSVKNEMADAIYRAHRAAIDDPSLPVPDNNTILSSWEWQIPGLSDQKAHDAALKEAYKLKSTGLEFIALAKDAVSQILGIGTTLPQHGINALADILRQEYETNKALGLLPPNDVEVLTPYTTYMNQWLTYGSTDAERKEFFDKSAKAMLGIDDITPPDTATALEGAVDDISDIIDRWTKQNPFDTSSPFQIASGIGKNYGLTPSGTLKRWESIDQTTPSYIQDWIQDPKFTLEPTGEYPEIPGFDFTGELSGTDVDALVEMYNQYLQDTAPVPPYMPDFPYTAAAAGEGGYSISDLPRWVPPVQPSFDDLFTAERAYGPKSAGDLFMEEWDAWREGMTPSDRIDFMNRQMYGSSPPPIPELAQRWARDYGTFDQYEHDGKISSQKDIFDPITGELISKGKLIAKGGAPAYDFSAYERDLYEQLELGNLTKEDAEGNEIPWDQADIDATLAARLRSQAGDPSYGSYPQPTLAQMRAPFEEMFGGSAAGREFIGGKLSDPDFFTGLSTQLGALSAQERLRHPQTRPTDPMSLVSAFPAARAESLGAEFKQEQQEQRTRKGELGSTGTTMFKRRTL